MSDAPCPCCGGNESSNWAEEMGYSVVRCQTCALLFVDPMPDLNIVDTAVKTGIQKLGSKIVNVRARRVASKVPHYKRRLSLIISDVIASGKPVTWVDVGCGYGELIEALEDILPYGSRVVGVEPMQHKADSTRAMGREVISDYLKVGLFEADFISNMDVFSHIPDYNEFLRIASSNLKEGGEIIIETGNAADVGHRSRVPGELGLPDHLVFSGQRTMERYFQNTGFALSCHTEERIDTVLQMSKNLVKLCIGRASHFCIPYTSFYRQVIYRARKI